MITTDVIWNNIRLIFDDRIYVERDAKANTINKTTTFTVITVRIRTPITTRDV